MRWINMQRAASGYRANVIVRFSCARQFPLERIQMKRTMVVALAAAIALVAPMAWAKKDTGIDPAAAAAPAPQQTGPATGGGERVRGAARGAVGGAVIGGIAGDAGTGAGVGAAAGTMAGGARARQNQAAQNQQAQQQQQQTLNTFYRAYGACMEGRGYTIK
jgi:hypothetical protein